MPAPQVTSFFHRQTNTITHVAVDPGTKVCAIIDPVLDYDAASGRISSDSADAVIGFVRRTGLALDWIIDTHIHADHLTAAHYIKNRLGGRTAIGARIGEVQNVFKDIFNTEPGFRSDGSQFDHLLADGETYKVGSIEARAIHTPGHTPACMTHVIGDACFVGDTLFMPDYGTARCDFPGGDAHALYHSVQKIFALPDETRMFLCHDYGTPERAEFKWETTVGTQRRTNRHIREGVDEEEFVRIRTERDETLCTPALLIPSVQINMRAGEMPPPESNGRRYLKIPLNLF